MGRKSTFSDESIFSAVSSQIVRGDDFRVQSLADETGISVGSLYHRYGSREGLLAEAWLDAVEAFQDRFLVALQGHGTVAGERAALATPHFCRTERNRAIILCIGRREALMNEKAPPEILSRVERLNANGRAVLADFAQRESLTMQACLHGIVAFPLASVRLYLPHQDVPDSVDSFVRAAYRSAISLRPQEIS